MHVTHFTDPACPFAFSAEPCRLQLMWHYGEQLQWRTVLVGLTASVAVAESRGFTPARLAGAFAGLQRRYGMPIDVSERPRLAASVPACRAVVAVRLLAPELEEAMLRRLRVRSMGGELLDADDTIDGAATDIGVSIDALRTQLDHPETEAQLTEDMRLARSPHAAALVLDHKLADAGDGSGARRYTCPSYELRNGSTVLALPGLQPWETYDVAVANTDATVTRRAAPGDVNEVLEWAPHALATAEVAALLGTSIDEARTQLADGGAAFDAVGADGYWSLPAA